MELRHLRYFVAVAEAAGFGRAARRLHVAQQALSKQVADLERELGARLLLRTARGVALTPAGAELLDYARRILAESARAVEHVRRLGGGARLRVAVLDYGPGTATLTRALSAFAARYPHVQVALAARFAFDGPAALAAGRVDVAFHLGFAPEPAADVVAERLHADVLAGVQLPATHPLSRAPALAPADLTALPLSGLPHALQPRETDDELARLRAAGWRGRLDHELTEGPPAVLAGQVLARGGWVHVPTWCATLDAPGLVYRALPAGGGTACDIFVVTRADGDPVVAAFVAGLREEAGAGAAAG